MTINLNSIVTLKTGKKDANASIKNGTYPFFTCSEKESSINVYSFDQEAILIAGNGNMSVKYYNGKFDAYQRTYVISSDKYFNLVSIHVVLRCDVFGQEDQIVVSVVWLLLEEESEMDFLTLLGKWKVGGFGCQGCH